MQLEQLEQTHNAGRIKAAEFEARLAEANSQMEALAEQEETLRREHRAQLDAFKSDSEEKSSKSRCSTHVGTTRCERAVANVMRHLCQSSRRSGDTAVGSEGRNYKR